MRALLLFACSCAAGAPSFPVPPPAAATADRIGVYAWGFDDAAWPKTPDRLTWAADEVAALGSHVIRVTLSPSDPYQVGSGATTLRELAARPAYAALWGDPRWSTILVTAYTQADLGNPWSDGYSHAEAAAERAELADLGRFLVGFPGKRFVILPWEGDNALQPFDSQVAWDGYADWITARAAGIADARIATDGEIYSGLEFNAVRRLDTGAACDDRCVLTAIAPKVSVDYYSYSAWQSVDGDLAGDLVTIGDTLRVPAANLIVGEVGAARDAPHATECSAAQKAIAALTAARDAGVSYAIAWQVIDNAPAGDALTGFGARKYDGTESMLGAGLRNLTADHVPPLPATSCGQIGDGGVVNGITFDHQIRAGDTISIFGTGFTTAGNVVHFTQGTSHVTVTTGSRYWYESPTQINATLPPSIGPGPVQAYVTGAADSNREPFGVM